MKDWLNKTKHGESLCWGEHAYVLVAKVQHKLGAVVLHSLCRQSDVELQGGVGSQVGHVTRGTNLDCWCPVKLHRHAHLDGGKRTTGSGNIRACWIFYSYFRCFSICVCVCVPCWQRCAPAVWAVGCGWCSQRCLASGQSDSVVDPTLLGV